ncbi:CoA pyrophosphatase [Corynebacterium sp. H128]|uniref:NUDIX hydrolase n=1 Tax=unclassified Corynebacterium TaxID=2624378 RepID=UPI00309C1543
MSDLPGFNTALRPADAPTWMKTLVDTARDGSIHGGLSQRARAAARSQAQMSAVLMLFSGRTAAEAEILLTHRTPTMRSHSGQIAFPGGRIDPDDSGAIDGALREAWEETGLDRRTVTPVAELAPLAIHATGNPVVPVLGFWHEPRELPVVSPLENDDIFRASISELARPTNRFLVRNGDWVGPAFWHRGYVVWGFTGGLLAATMRFAGWEEPWDPIEIDLRTALRSSRNNEP